MNQPGTTLLISKFSQIPKANVETSQNVRQSNVDEYSGQQNGPGRHALQLEEARANQRVKITKNEPKRFRPNKHTKTNDSD